MLRADWGCGVGHGRCSVGLSGLGGSRLGLGPDLDLCGLVSIAKRPETVQT